ncbi:MAG: HD domain-containing protein [Eubacteriales bacterium]|nr:HD domain-containing protein [Eubacteriales bacterium]
MITYDIIRNNESVRTYIKNADEVLGTLGFTEHSFAHVTKVADTANYILSTLGYSKAECEIGMIAGYLHDIGNVVNRIDHAQSGAMMAYRILDSLGATPDEIAVIIGAIGNHDETTAVAVSPVAAALILADKTDVRNTRVRNKDMTTFDIHDRVNYSVKKSNLTISDDKLIIELELTIDTNYSSVMDYFEIFIGRMILCRKAAEKLGMKFKLDINGQQLL